MRYKNKKQVISMMEDVKKLWTPDKESISESSDVKGEASEGRVGSNGLLGGGAAAQAEDQGATSPLGGD